MRDGYGSVYRTLVRYEHGALSLLIQNTCKNTFYAFVRHLNTANKSMLSLEILFTLYPFEYYRSYYHGNYHISSAAIKNDVKHQDEYRGKGHHNNYFSKCY
jgi:hypothetical protein